MVMFSGVENMYVVETRCSVSSPGAVRIAAVPLPFASGMRSVALVASACWKSADPKAEIVPSNPPVTCPPST